MYVFIISSVRATENRWINQPINQSDQASRGGGGGGGTYISALGRHMLIILARVRRLGALAPDDPELLRRQHGLPFVLALLDRVVGHVFLFRLTAEQGAQEGDAGHRPEKGVAVGSGEG